MKYFYTKEQLQNNFNDTIETFDFEKILSVTKFLNYKWLGRKIETIEDMKDYVVYHWNKITENTTSTSFDGFQLSIEWDTGFISLKYILEDSVGMFLD